ncbi:MAG: hypothetical protein KIT60_12020 [Burkholderiaceae bacterium]|nr:hypothetical protein [Burkholderiaceae bacterium]
MSRRLDPPWRKWFLLYLGTAVLGSFAVLGRLLPVQWLDGWLWWQRLLLVLLGSPVVIAAYLGCEAIVEGLLRVAGNALRERPLPVVVGLLALASLLYAFVHLFPF